MKRLIILLALSIQFVFSLPLWAGERWVVEPSLPYYGHPSGMQAGSLLNPYEVRRAPSGRYEMATPFPDSSRPMMAPGQPLNPLEIRPIR